MPPRLESPSRARREIRGLLVDYLGMLVALGLLIATFGLSARNFFSSTTLLTIASQIPAITIVSSGMTLVLIIAGIDLSVGSVLALSSAVLGLALTSGWPLAAAIGASLAVGLACGAVSGLICVGWGIPSFIVTLGMLEAARGGAYLVTGSRTIYIGEPVERIAEATILGLSLPTVIALLVVIAGQLVLTRTVFGRYAIACGTNEEAARLSGVPTGLVRWCVFAACGLLTALASVMHTARLTAADPNTGVGLELQAIAAVVIGGTSLMGGRGSVVRTFLGVLIIAVLDAGLDQVGAREPTKRLITGLVIVAAVVLDHYRHRLARR